ncbi:MAG: UDP-4-amino-4,6-dideoxy-N-acetyl-beta-L-altrosamine transaminase [Reinekea sp.]
MIPYSQQWINEDDRQALVDVLHSDYLTQGPKIAQFETALAKAVEVPCVRLTSSATSALHVACLALGVGPGDRVWTSAMSFVASANCAVYCGADIEFVDIDEATGNMSSNALSGQLETAAVEGRLPSVVIPVHFAGQSCDMQAIDKLANQYSFKVIEDASHALGGQYQNRPVGRCDYSDITVFSFHPVKMITTGEGGCLCVQDAALDKRIQKLISHGITKDPNEFVTSMREPWAYEQQMLGFNYRMTDMQAALGLSQLERLNRWVEKRNQMMARYRRLTVDLPIRWLNIADNVLCSFHLAVIKVAAEQRLALFEFLRQHQVGVQVHYIPIYKQPFYRDSHKALPNTEHFYQQIISLPLFPKMSVEQQDRVVALLQEFFQ